MGVTNADVYADGFDTLVAVKANAATASIAIADFPKNNTNTGAGGTIVLTLPAAASVEGQKMRVYLTVAQIVRVDPYSTESIYLAGSGTAGKYLNIAGVIGNYCDIYSDGTYFYVTGFSGVVTKES